MDNTTNNPNSSGSSGNNFNNNPKPLPSYNGGATQISDILKEASHTPGVSSSAGANIDTTPAFSGMPHSQGGTSMPKSPSVDKTPDFSSFKRPEFTQTATTVSNTSTSSQPTSVQSSGGASPFASAISKQTMSDYKDSQKKIATSGGSYSHIYMWSIISIIVLALIGGGIYWYLFMGGKDVVFPTQTSQTEELPVNNTPKPSTSLPVAPRPTSPVSNTPVKPTNTTTVKQTSPGPFSGSDKDLVSQYIRKNINSLSPRKSTIGFSVSDIVFDGPNRAIVSYGNRSVSYNAAVNATVTNGVVKITSFTVLEK